VRWLIYLGIALLGILVFSQAIAMMGFEPLPGDIMYDRDNWHIHIPVLYSLGAVAIVMLIFWIGRR
jgi:Protein of unknown function (DUF2905)